MHAISILSMQDMIVTGLHQKLMKIYAADAVYVFPFVSMRQDLWTRKMIKLWWIRQNVRAVDAVLQPALPAQHIVMKAGKLQKVKCYTKLKVFL